VWAESPKSQRYGFRAGTALFRLFLLPVTPSHSPSRTLRPRGGSGQVPSRGRSAASPLFDKLSRGSASFSIPWTRIRNLRTSVQPRSAKHPGAVPGNVKFLKRLRGCNCSLCLLRQLCPLREVVLPAKLSLPALLRSEREVCFTPVRTHRGSIANSAGPSVVFSC